MELKKDGRVFPKDVRPNRRCSTLNALEPDDSARTTTGGFKGTRNEKETPRNATCERPCQESEDLRVPFQCFHDARMQMRAPVCASAHGRRRRRRPCPQVTVSCFLSSPRSARGMNHHRSFRPGTTNCPRRVHRTIKLHFGDRGPPRRPRSATSPTAMGTAASRYIHTCVL